MGTRIIGMRFAATGLLLLCVMMPMPAATITVTNTDPLLGPLADNGGPTRTHALLPGSPAINAGNSSGAPATDQRGAGRVGPVDIGAYEFVPTNRLVDITADENDGNFAPGDLSLAEAIFLAN